MPQGDILLQALAQIATSVGLSSALILFFVWQSWKREEKTNARTEKLEDFCRDQLVQLTKETTGALIQDAEATKACAVAVTGLSQSMQVIDKRLTDHDELSRKAIEALRESLHREAKS